MLNKKLGMWMGILFLLLLTACSQTQEGKDGEKPNKDIDSTVVKQEPVDSFMHIHGLSYALKEPYNLYMSTHHGLVQIDSTNQWNWVGELGNRHDLMGFVVQNEETMISSGHPAEGSRLKNPLGVVISKDQGATWEPLALHGQVDFHVFEVNAGNSSVLYGINSHGANAGLYQSVDGGSKWDKIKAKGLPEDLMTVFSLISDPENPQSLLAGTQVGILESADGGKTWTLKSNSQTFTSAKGIKEPSGKIVTYVIGENEGLMFSNDFGDTWTSLNLQLGEDVATHIAIHPQQEGIYAVGTSKEHVLQTTDNGQTWKTLAESGKPQK